MSQTGQNDQKAREKNNEESNALKRSILKLSYRDF